MSALLHDLNDWFSWYLLTIIIHSILNITVFDVA